MPSRVAVVQSKSGKSLTVKTHKKVAEFIANESLQVRKSIPLTDSFRTYINNWLANRFKVIAIYKYRNKYLVNEKTFNSIIDKTITIDESKVVSIIRISEIK